MEQWGAPMESYPDQCFRGLNLGPERPAVIRHATDFDDQLARACMQINQDKKQGLPIIGYTAIAAAPNPVAVQENIYQSINNYLRNAIEEALTKWARWGA